MRIVKKLKKFFKSEDKWFIVSDYVQIYLQQLRKSGNVFITNITYDYKKLDVHILEQELLFDETKIGDGCFIGFGAVIQPSVILGKQCVVGSNAVVMAGNYPDFCVIVGCPA